jgi:hypothetical protein
MVAPGCDPVSLVAYLENVSQGEAAQRLVACLASNREGGAMSDAFERFKPLSEEEKAAGFSAASTSNAPKEEGELVSPIPSDAPGAPKWHCPLGNPSQVWTYRDAYGATLFHILRFDPPRMRKVFLPLSLWRDGTDFGWRWNHVPPLRPLLYNLDMTFPRFGGHWIKRLGALPVRG